jgi:ketosteroid isomerase-like protein
MIRSPLSILILSTVGTAVMGRHTVRIEQADLWIARPPITVAASSSRQATQSETDANVIATERAALERWDRGDPGGYLGTYANDVTYFDPSVDRRVDGLQAMTELLTPIRGKIRVDRFDMLNPKVQRHGDVAVLTYNIVNYRRQPDGTERATARWNSTAVFQRIGGRWRTIHSHFSYTKPELKDRIEGDVGSPE